MTQVKHVLPFFITSIPKMVLLRLLKLQCFHEGFVLDIDVIFFVSKFVDCGGWFDAKVVLSSFIKLLLARYLERFHLPHKRAKPLLEKHWTIFFAHLLRNMIRRLEGITLLDAVYMA